MKFFTILSPDNFGSVKPADGAFDFDARAFIEISNASNIQSQLSVIGVVLIEVFSPEGTGLIRVGSNQGSRRWRMYIIGIDGIGVTAAEIAELHGGRSFVAAAFIRRVEDSYQSPSSSLFTDNKSSLLAWTTSAATGAPLLYLRKSKHFFN